MALSFGLVAGCGLGTQGCPLSSLTLSFCLRAELGLPGISFGAAQNQRVTAHSNASRQPWFTAPSALFARTYIRQHTDRACNSIDSRR